MKKLVLSLSIAISGVVMSTTATIQRVQYFNELQNAQHLSVIRAITRIISGESTLEKEAPTLGHITFMSPKANEPIYYADGATGISVFNFRKRRGDERSPWSESSIRIKSINDTYELNLPALTQENLKEMHLRFSKLTSEIITNEFGPYNKGDERHFFHYAYEPQYGGQSVSVRFEVIPRMYALEKAYPQHFYIVEISNPAEVSTR